MDNIRFHTFLLPTFSGKQEHLESFILSIDEFYSLYFNNSDEQRRLVTAAIKSKLVEDARNFYLSRPDLISWPEIKLGLRQKFGDPTTYFVLMQQLQYLKIERNEGIMPFVDRLKTFVQRIIAKIQCEVVDPTSKATLLIQVENTSVLILTANSPQTLKTMLMIQRPTTLDDAVQCVVNYDMIESQVNFINNNFPSTRNPTERSNNFKSNQNRTPPNIFRNQVHPVALPPQNRPQTFPSQPIPIQSRPINRYYPTNAQVFGQSKPLLPGKRQDSPTPMSTSTAGPFRLQQQRQPSVRYQNYFVPTGPRNFVSQELTNVEIHPQSTSDPDQTLEENYPNDYPPYHVDDLKESYDYNQGCNLLQNLEANEENFENFPNPASYPELT
ncbi:hypothetical protein ABEB36_013513 [Hypothenemus hampei]|uniref:Retrotransposon gag domain-containing protein n=1 Tax=Hypothenemus hampei TaxID=57062 RepID=A0ABD1E4T3_HYPHA